MISKQELIKLTGCDGRGLDKKGTRRDGLSLSWKWSTVSSLSGMNRKDHRRLPCQVCYAEFEFRHTLYRFSVCRWTAKGQVTYEARFEIDGERVKSKEGFEARLIAQFAAEKMLAELIKDMRAANRKYITPFPNQKEEP